MKQEQKPKSSKIKLKLVQPQIMCVDRKPITCHYRGEIIETTSEFLKIKFKSYQQETIVIFCGDICITDGWQDLQIIK